MRRRSRSAAERRRPTVYIHVVSYDLGFAPNPFNAVCTLACCKPVIRRTAKRGDWVIGMGGRELKATGRCIYAMRVTDHMTFEEYWDAPRFKTKQPKRNGSPRVIVGDNIYHRDPCTGGWLQENSVHSQPDGKLDPHNTQHDTGTNRVLISDDFVYFGDSAPMLPAELLDDLGYTNGNGHRVFDLAKCEWLLAAIRAAAGSRWNELHGDPFQFRSNHKRYDLKKKKLV